MLHISPRRLRVQGGFNRPRSLAQHLRQDGGMEVHELSILEALLILAHPFGFIEAL